MITIPKPLKLFLPVFGALFHLGYSQDNQTITPDPENAVASKEIKDTLYLKDGTKYPFNPKSIYQIFNAISISDNKKHKQINIERISHIIASDTERIYKVYSYRSSSLPLFKMRTVDGQLIPFDTSAFARIQKKAAEKKLPSIKRDTVTAKGHSFSFGFGANIPFSGNTLPLVMPDGGEVRFIQGNCFQLEYIYAPPKNISGGFGVNFTTATNVITSGNNNPEETLRFTSFSMGPVFAINHKNTSIQIGSFFGLTRWNERLLYQRPESYPNKAIEVTLNGKTAFSINPSLKFKYTVIKGLFVFNTLSINILNTSIELSSRDPKDTSASIAKTTNTAHDFSNLRFLLGFGYNF